MDSGLGFGIRQVVVQTNGMVMVSGDFNYINDIRRKGIARLNGDGSVDYSFDPGNGPDFTGLGVIFAQNGGKVIVGGDFTTFNGVSRKKIAKLNSDGTVDTGFDPGPYPGREGGNSTVRAIAVQADGKILIAGTFRDVNATFLNGIARLNPDGSVDTAFNTWTEGSVFALVLQRDGRILIGGDFRYVNGALRRNLARLNSIDGSLDETFESSGALGLDFPVSVMAVQPDGKLVVCGMKDNVFYRPVVRLNPEGGIDSGFETDSSKDLISALAVQSDGKLAIGGTFTTFRGIPRQRFARLAPNGTLDLTFLSNAGADSPVSSVALQADGKIVIAGNFSTVNGVRQARLARLHGAQKYMVGQEITQPPSTFAPMEKNPNGPSSIPAGVVCWDAMQRKLYALVPGEHRIRWTDTNNQPLDVPITVAELPAPNVIIGEELSPPDGFDSGILLVSGPQVAPEASAKWDPLRRKLIALREGSVGVTWASASNACPRIPKQYIVSWPDDPAKYQMHIAGTPPVSLQNVGTFTHAMLFQDATVGSDRTEVTDRLNFQASGPGRSVVFLSQGDPRTSTNYAIQFIHTIPWDDPAYLRETNAVIGQALVAPMLHDPGAGAPWVQNALSRYCVFTSGYWSPTNRLGSIIPVNRDTTNTTADDLVVTYYQKGNKLLNPSTSNLVASSIGWPYQAVRYHAAWPPNAPKVTLASGVGTGVLGSPEHQNWQLYVQNDPALPGFNPNDEHAVVQQAQGETGLAVFPLRDDLGTEATSEPYVLVRYQDGLDGAKPKLKVFRVEAGPLLFNGNTAGRPVQPPYPLSLLQSCRESYGFSGPYWRDRKLDFWAKAAGNDGGATNMVMRWFYPIQPGFYFPSNYFVYFPTNVAATNLPPVGTHFPWLDLRAGTPRTPHDVTYTVNWPATQELRVGETLVKRKNHLPEISSQTSVEIIYQQSLATGQEQSAKLIDPKRIVEVTNVMSLPGDVATYQSGGRTWFPALPPHLRPRLWYDGVSKALRYEGWFMEPPGGEYYLLLNVITDRDRQELLKLTQDPVFQGHLNALAEKAAHVIEVPPNTPFDRLAVTAGAASGRGYVTLAFGNSTNLTPVNGPVDLEIFSVNCPLYRGELKVIQSEGPFDEKLTLRHTGDFAGRADDYIFEWRTLPPDPVTGDPQTSIPFDQWAPYMPQPSSGQGALDITIEGSGLFTISDNYFVCRYRPVQQPPPLCVTVTNLQGWSEWTAPQLAPGWIKRVVGRINPFTQRAEGDGLEGAETRFAAFNKAVNTIVSMISQAGPRFEGSIPFNADAVNNFGLIEIYETVLKRGMDLSIAGNPPVNYGPANDALLLAAGRLSDLYMLLGNEAYADASDPTIAIPHSNDSETGKEAASIHCFQNLTASLLEEELALLRGRDGSVTQDRENPSITIEGVTTAPVYNRLIWNFTRDITGGEVAYVLNYNIRDASGVVDGVLDEADAKKLYPQGHGDAWGHYLTAISGYYQLLHSPYFAWVPRTEAVLVGGVPVQVDYLDERKFAKAALARAQTGAEIMGLTYREQFSEDPAQQWQGYRDSNTNRAWGVSDWGSRAGQGAFFDWVVGNALLPATSTNTGIQKVDRTTVTELRDLASSYLNIQEQVDKADTGLNPLGLTKNTIPFDIDPVLISANKTHFEQIYERAVSALVNAIAVFNHANNNSQALRQQADSIAKFQQDVTEREADFNNRLIESFGYPYPGDIGPAGSYPSGYNGPDLDHYMYVDPSAILGQTVQSITEFTVTISDLNVAANGSLNSSNKVVKFHLADNGLGLVKPSNWTAPRRAPGEIQRAHSDLLQAKARFERALQEYENLLAQIEDQAELLRAQYRLNGEEINVLITGQNRQESLNAVIRRSRDRQLDFQTKARTATLVANAVSEALPKQVGFSYDPFSVLRSAILLAGNVVSEIAVRNANSESLVELDHQQAKELAQSQANIQLTTVRQELSSLQQLKQLEQLVRQEALSRLELYTMQEAMQQAAGNYSGALARGQRIHEDLLRFRQQTAAQVQQYRYGDMAFRIFRNDALQKYRAQFDTAAMYVYLAAKAYDFETNLRPGDPGQPGREFLNQIVRARTVGKINNGIPEVGFNGDPGLADPMARMSQNFAVLKTQLGFNNPQVTV
ncbi:MAG TPA: hypothetical protein VN673_05780, partial [Clostridia bacterium]|nr:hypothetical protein [Clostridia bacterium]